MAMAKPVLSLLVHLHAALLFVPDPAAGAMYNVLRYGARADGVTDSAGPFLRAWADACRSPTPATVYVPPGRFLVGLATFSGPCSSRAVTFSIAGTVVAPEGYGGRGSSGRWITFENVEGLTVSGGTLDGRGGALWACKRRRHGGCPTGASSLTISNSRDVVVDGVRSVDSELFHVVVLQCRGVTVRGVTVEAPADSPNTDGIHVHMSSHVSVYDARIHTGDDCISVGPGNSHLWIERVACGPGHGISIGSLGMQQGMAVEAVQNVTVKTTWFTGTMNGLRIKTWGGSKRGFVRGVTFMDATMSGVDNPIIIDQNYCPNGRGCPRMSSSIKISEVKYVDIRGSSATPVAVNFDCSRSNPCSGISLQDVALTYRNRVAKSYCQNAQGITLGLVLPPSCL
ncbi:polygalacturonase-like [Phragmites australis]|uniref:polygalacturonase-like n=1 Tax=Phragmites australis TaxID=29695 RepID=UPI002D77BEDA|nr:polygalacturonase-like [Phragmites australis]